MIPMPFFLLAGTVLGLYVYVVVATVVMSWLLAFNVINPGNRFVHMIWRALSSLTEPLLRPVRRIVPAPGGVDLSPLVLLLGLYFLREMNVWLSVRIGIP